ncbi:RDD family protein [Parasphingorhabdus cellanae]|uniref:RDD family protein n=1 Tax=Parasphingorhabdus cellanae TaxID=2806553 RepID=A0ABX7T0M5_9SPHN|nr:RDD family protein [Parasphingorhabdus cellanae]QTD55101.1 RDD family protein [Parasphingorhabdus cellanae]
MSATTTDPWTRRSANPKLDRVMVSPEGVPLNVTVATAGARAGALTLDIIIILGLILGVTLLGLLILWGFESAFGEGLILEESGPLSVVAVLWIIAVFLFRNAYFLYFELGDRAATWGKRAVGIRVAARDGGRLTAEAVIARNIIRDIELFLPLMFITSGEAEGTMTDFTAWAGFLWVLMFLLFPVFNKDRLRCGDLIAGTWVIQNVKRNLGGVVAPSAEAIADPATGTTTTRYEFSDEDLSVYGEYELQTLESVLRTGTDEALETVTSSICNKIGWEPGSGDKRIFLESYYTALRAKLEGGMRFGKRRKDKYSADI